jgi:hypothetical protein
MGNDVQVCTLLIYNGGPAAARDVRVWARNAEGLDVAGQTPVKPPTILPGGTPANAAIEVSTYLLSDSLDVWVAWRDDDGDHAEQIDRLPPPN